MRTRQLAIIVLFIMTTGLAAYDTSVAASPLHVTLQQYLVVTRQTGEMKHESLEQLTDEATYPGQTIEYVLKAENSTDAQLADVVLQADIPAGTSYVGGSSFPAGLGFIQFSIDGGRSFQSPPVRRSVLKADGTREFQIAGPDLYTNIRWVFLQPFPGGGSFEFRYKVLVK